MLIQCPECGKEISDKAVSCPHCGYPIHQIQPQTVSAETNEVSAENESESSRSVPSKNNSTAKIAGLIIAGVLIVAAIVIWGILPALNKPAELSGDSKIAYEIILTNAYCFPYPDSVRIEGGMLSTDGDMLFCTLSYKTPQGKKYTGYYVVYPTSVKEIGDVDSEYADVFEETNFLDIKQINVNLAESLG